MDCRIEGLVMRASALPDVDFKMIAQVISEDTDKGYCKEMIYKDLYKKIYKNHLQYEECEEFIDSLQEKEKKGSIWSIEETNSVAKKLEYDFMRKSYSKDEFRTAMHLYYYELYYPLKESGVTLESTTYGRLADSYFDYDGKLIDCYFEKMCKC